MIIGGELAKSGFFGFAKRPDLCVGAKPTPLKQLFLKNSGFVYNDAGILVIEEERCLFLLIV